MIIKEIYKNYQELLDKNIQINGWVITARSQKEFTFIKVLDGSHPEGIQIIVEGDSTKYSTGMSVMIEGLLIKSPAKGQLFEVKSEKIKILGQCDTNDYPLSKSGMSLDYLRKYCHLRARTSTFGSVFRIKSAISHATHSFFAMKNYLHLDPNILTINECEGGAGVFQVTERDISIPGKLPLKMEEVLENNRPVKKPTELYDWSSDHFKNPVYLTVSSQLQLEAISCALGSVYTTNKSFRSEHSSTNKHLSEFTHLEIESCFLTLDDLMTVGEEYIKYVGNYILTNNIEDVDNLGKFVSKGLKERITGIIEANFNRISYDEAIKIAQEKGMKIVYGDDLSSEIENCLTEHFNNNPVFVFNWPMMIKSFYMKQDESNPNLCNNFDLLMPYKVGELIGGSMREDNYDKLIAMMKIKGVSEEPMKFYTDLRKFGSVPHGGFGLGFDRMTMLFTSMDNIKDTIPFPVYYGHCDY